MNASRRVSVVIPCYNQGRFLAEALQSVFAQTHAQLEIVVVDDGSSDATASIAASFGQRIRFLQQPHKGPSAARNLALASCTGAYLQFLDADDMIEPDKIRAQVAFLEARPDIGIVYSDVRYFSSADPDERALGPYSADGVPFTPMLWAAPGTMLEKLIDRNVLAINSALMRRQAAAAVGPWNESLSAVEDWEYWIRCAHAGVRFQYQDAPGTLALVRLHPESGSANPARVALGVHQMRVSLSRVLEDPEVRATNCGRAIELCLAPQVPQRTRRFLELARATRGLGNRLRILAAWGLLAPWAGNTARAVAWRLTPGIVRRMLSRMLRLEALRAPVDPARRPRTGSR